MASAKPATAKLAIALKKTVNILVSRPTLWTTWG
jgi:hypothetical protein